MPSLFVPPILFSLLSLGDAGRAKRHRRSVRCKDPEEGRGDPGRRCGMHHGGEESASIVWKAAFLDSAALHLPKHGGWHAGDVFSQHIIRYGKNLLHRNTVTTAGMSFC